MALTGFISARESLMFLNKNERIDLKDFFEKYLTNSSLISFASLFSNERSRNRTNEICFYTYDHLLDIFLDIRVSRYEQKRRTSKETERSDKKNLKNFNILLTFINLTLTESGYERRSWRWRIQNECKMKFRGCSSFINIWMSTLSLSLPSTIEPKYEIINLLQLQLLLYHHNTKTAPALFNAMTSFRNQASKISQQYNLIYILRSLSLSEPDARDMQRTPWPEQWGRNMESSRAGRRWMLTALACTIFHLFGVRQLRLSCRPSPARLPPNLLKIYVLRWKRQKKNALNDEKKKL